MRRVHPRAAISRAAVSRAAAAFGAAVLLAATSAHAADMVPEPIAVLEGLDKTTARVSRFEAPVGTPVRFGTLSIVVRDCERNAPEEAPENAAFLEIDETRPGEQKTRLFSGWMFSSSPALSALEHPVYDVTVIECKASAPPMAPAPALPPSPPPAPSPPGRSRGNTGR